MRRFLISLLTAAFFLAVLIGSAIYGYKLNPVQRAISDQSNQWSKIVPLDIARLQAGSSEDKALEWLGRKGFEITDMKVSERVANREGAPDWERTYAPVTADHILSRRSGGIPCAVSYVVLLDVEAGSVERARGMQIESGCM